jgi:hypothetical protein
MRTRSGQTELTDGEQPQITSEAQENRASVFNDLNLLFLVAKIALA